MTTTLDVGEVLSEVTRDTRELVEDFNAALARICLFGPETLPTFWTETNGSSAW